MSECRVCNACDNPGRYETSPEKGLVPCNVRAFANQSFTVWRCVNCGSLHCLEDIDYARYYAAYPIHGQRADFFTRLLFRSRLSLLRAGGLARRHAVLDYGCGNGGFVAFLQHAGYPRARGYDPHCPPFDDAAVLAQPYDFVVCQDVIEHAPDTRAFLRRVLACARPDGGIVAIGTPDASRLRVASRLDAAGRLHQPYHRHLLTRTRLEALLADLGARRIRTVRRWYADTSLPFLNSSFFFRYVLAAGGDIDVMFEPVRLRVLLRAPHLLWHALAGALFQPRKDVLIFAVRSG